MNNNSQSHLFESRVIFQYPDRVVAPFFWVGHIPFAFFIVEQLKPRIVVELGVHTGNSFNAFCQAVDFLDLTTQCFGIDTWEGDDHTGLYSNDIYSELFEYQQQNYKSFSKLIRSKFNEAVDQFEDGSIDLLHIDGCHYYEEVKGDFESWLPKLSERSVVMFHDTQMEGNDFGTKKYWNEISPEYPSVEFQHSAGLGILATGRSLKLELFKLSPEEVAWYQKFFARLGQTCINLAHLESEIDANKGNTLEAMNYRQKIISITEDRAELRQKNHDLKMWIENYRNSWSYRLGRMITKPLSVLKVTND